MMQSDCGNHVLLIGSSSAALLGFRGPLIQDIRAAGHRISVSAPGFLPKERRSLEALGAEVHNIALSRTGLNPLADLTYAYALLRLMHRIRPDRVLTYTIKPNVWGAWAAAHAGIPSYAMVTGLGYMFTEAGPPSAKKRIVRAAASLLYARATARNCRVIFQNPDDRDDFIRFGCLQDAGKAMLINGSGIDMAHYARVPLPEKPSFLMVARLLNSKGVREYAEAAIALRRRHPDVHFRVVGYFDEGHDTVPRADMEAWVAAGLDYPGPMSDIRPAMANASVYVLPSYREGTPRSVLEAMAMGRPVITTDTPGCRETVRDGENGFLVPARDAGALVDAMERFILDPALIEPMGLASWCLARDRYEVGAVNREIMQIIDL
ncbi:glycosyltransferase family 4 protein [Roseovarius amoyensis]|uniref:glycosyltransferase family 4 protein n=1 Tax=Roseovarius amoyensis TaxID=2211448 RepID=UPI00195506B0|nr:glycosyltransferase family 4 protein [Roseovarius amoyensis]